jgi:glycerophosphoryl diester phosphodiesterase
MTNKPDVIIHRAGGFLAPENTIYAMETGLTFPVDGIEIDVQFTKDDIPVVYHDNTLRRTTGKRRAVKRLTYDSIKDLDNGSWFDRSLTDVRIDTLDAFLNAFNGRSTLYVEIKEHGERLLDIPKMIKSFQLQDKVIFLSFHFELLLRIKEHYPNMTVMFLLGARWKKPFSYCQDDRIDWYGLSFQLAYKKQHLVKEILDAGYHVNIWSCNQMEIASTLIDLGITSITTDKPEEMLGLVQQKSLHK